MLKYVFGFAEYPEKATYGIGYRFRLTRKSDSSVLNKTNASNKAKNKINGIESYVPHYIASLEQQKIISKQI